MNIPHAWSRWGCALLLLLAGDAFAQAPRPAPAPVDSLTLDAARARALADHPGLLAAGLEVDARAAEARQAGRRPNPELGLEVENFGGGGDWSGFGGAEYTLGVAQVIELGGKAGARGEAARLAGVQAGRDVAVRRLDVVLATTRAYLAALTARREVRLAAELVDIAHRDRAEVARRVAAGAVSPLETARADIAVGTAELELEDRRQALVAARAHLAATWGGDPDFGPLADRLPGCMPPPPLDELRRRLAANPDLARWADEAALRRAEVALARADGTLDVTVSGGIRHDAASGDNAFVAGVALPLPVADRGRDRADAASLRRDAAAHERDAVEADLAANLAARHAELTAAHAAVHALRDELLPTAASAMDAAAAAYREGRFGYTDVLAVRRTWAELRLRHIATLARYHTAVAEIERLVAGPLAGPAADQPGKEMP